MNSNETNDREQKDLVLLLREELQLLDKAAEILKYSYGVCGKIGIKEEYSFEELDKFESFTGRFARLSDLLIQKIFRLIDDIELESSGTIRDRINRAEKKELIESADVFIEIRVVRNQVAHEYIQDEIQEQFEKVLEYAPHLLDSVKRVKKYCRRYIL
ncbi:MAG: hypothetical protein QG657_4724 [Acidobacteriota bacterium]|nr:hypothetical protein [Acidobacteriota bacterium]